MIFFASFGAGYRTTEYAYGQDGMSFKANRHPVFPDKIDGRGYVLIEASSMGRARYLARTYFQNEYAGVYETSQMWDDWEARDNYYSGGPAELKRDNDGSLVLGIITDNGLTWGNKVLHAV